MPTASMHSDVNLEVVESLGDDFILAPNDAPRYLDLYPLPSTQYGMGGYIHPKKEFVKYWFLVAHSEMADGGWMITPCYYNNGMELWSKPIESPAGDMWAWRVFDEKTFGRKPVSAGYFDLAKGEYTGPNPAAAKDNVNFMNLLPKDIWIYHLPREWNYGPSMTHRDGWVGPYYKTVFYLDLSWNAFKKGQDLGPAWGIPCPMDPRLLRV